MKFSSKSSLMGMLVMVVAVLMLWSVSPTSAQAFNSITNSTSIPPCLSKFSECSKNINNDSPDPCCPEWKDAVDNSQQCLCNFFIANIPNFNSTDLSPLFQMCGIQKSADTLCQGVKSNTGSGSGSYGNVASKTATLGFLPSALLFLAMIMN